MDQLTNFTYLTYYELTTNLPGGCQRAGRMDQLTNFTYLTYY